jgi:hypothetical protein
LDGAGPGQVEGGPEQAIEVDADMLVEVVILRRQQRCDELRRDLLKADFRSCE